MNNQQHFSIKNNLPPGIKYTCDIEQNGDKVIFKEFLERELTLKESLKALRFFRQDILIDKNNIKGLEEYIKRKEQHKLLRKHKEDMTQFEKVEKKWTKLIVPVVNELRKKVKYDVQMAKFDKKYNPHDYGEDDGDRKIIVQNSILAPIAMKHGLDMNDPVILEVKRSFDNLEV